MKWTSQISRLTLALLLVAGTAALAHAYPRFARATNMSCATCHVNPAGGPDLSDAGKAFKADSTKVPAASVEGSAYVSNRKCRVCHAAEYKSWLTTPHSAAMDTLRLASHEAIMGMSKRLGVTVEGAATANETCISCHTTGYGLPGGYPMPADVGKATGADSARVAALASVSCESCHGPGSKHVAAEKSVKKTLINHDVGEGTCRGCHTAATSPNFDFAKYKAKGVHEIVKKTE